MKINRNHLLLGLIISFGAFFRFYKLDWGQGLFTHPDEYHIVNSVSQLSFPIQMNPHFFSYGTVIIYLIYFTKELLSAISHQLSAINLFILGRFYSALFSSLTIFLVYKISQKIMPSKYALIAAFLTATTAGLIQQAHFLTPESTLIFFLMGSLFFLLQFTQSPTPLKSLILASIFLGLGLGVKISGAIFLVPLLLVICIKLWPKFLQITKLTIISLASILLILVIVDPYIFLDFSSFKGNLEYEGGLAAGKFIVFYTRQFLNTTPVLFQLEKIYPYTLGPTLLVLGFLGILGMTFTVFKNPNLRIFYLLLLISFFSLFLPNALLFAQWTRFSSPTFPFFAIFSAFVLYKFSQLKPPKIFYLLPVTCYLLSIAWTISFFSIYLKDDIRITSSRWMESNLPPSSTILVESGNTIDLPLQGDFGRISIDFYKLEQDPLVHQQVFQVLDQSDYFIIQSRRVFLNHQRLPNQFPKITQFYNDLFTGKLGFTKIKEFHSYPTLFLPGLEIEFPDEEAEETWSVFDHPVIRVFQKI